MAIPGHVFMLLFIALTHWKHGGFGPNFEPIVTSLKGWSNGWVLQLWAAKIFWVLSIKVVCLVENEEEEGPEWREERECQGVHAWRKRKERGSCINYQNAPPSLFLFIIARRSIIGTDRLICIPYSKPKSNNMISHRLFTPKYDKVRFNKHRTSSKVDNLIVLEILIDLVLVNNL